MPKFCFCFYLFTMKIKIKSICHFVYIYIYFGTICNRNIIKSWVWLFNFEEFPRKFQIFKILKEKKNRKKREENKRPNIIILYVNPKSWRNWNWNWNSPSQVITKSARIPINQSE